MLRAVFDFFKRTAVVSLFSLGVMLLLGWILALIQDEHRATFFSYRINLFDNLPAWFLYSLILIFLNGRYLLKASSLQGNLNTPRDNRWGNWSISFPIPPLEILGYNLITIPVLLFSFVIVRWFQL